MKSGESVTDYFSRVMAIVNKMGIHGDKSEDIIIIEKILRSMTPKFNFFVCSIEESNDIDNLSIDELQSSLLVHEQKLKQQETEEQALKASTDIVTSSTQATRGRGHGRKSGDRRHFQQYHNSHHDSYGRGQGGVRGRGHGRGAHHFNGYKPKAAGKANVECFKCHRYGHYKSECLTNTQGGHANFAETEEEVSLLMVCHADENTNRQLWYLDI